ncbi:PAS domain S-box protein [Sulfidibacter corallicola]|uniref:Sensor protein FixL n=1 Tax=Sulfidibacter corallicola TaxID=2818388 RepID=A0A8A4TGS4_SULCO|nr:PAS domain S-box protein [Sulfidibacter corallicola]
MARFCEIFKNMGLVGFVLDANGRVMYANPYLCSLLHVDETKLLGSDWFAEWILADQADELRALFRESWQSDSTGLAQVEYPALRKEREVVVLSLQQSMFFDREGQRLGLVFVGEEVTGRRALEEALIENETIKSIVFDNALDAVITVDQNGTIASFNKAAEHLFGYTVREVLERNVSMLMPEPYRSQHDSYIQRYLESGNPKIIGKGREALGLRKDGQTFPLYLSVSREAQIGGKKIFVGIVRDLSKEKQVEAQLRQAQKMEAIGTLAGGIAHDFNNILGGIFGYVELMLEDAEDGSYLKEDLQEMMKACVRGKELVQQILTFSRQDQPRREPVHLQPVVKESLKLLRATLPSTIEIHRDIDPNLGTVAVDPTQIHQVMMNLCTNAYHAMRESGGILTVRLSHVVFDETHNFEVRNLPFGHYALLSVADTGVGMSEQTMARIFDPFFTTKRLGEGTGMGLSVVHGIVENHEGTIQVESELGRGTCFKVYLPIRNGNVGAGESQDTTSRRGREHIYLVEDDPFLLKVQGRLLDRQGYRVTSFKNGSEALEAFLARPGEADLVISDQTMPKLAGVDLAKSLLKHRPNLPVILTTGFSDVLSLEETQRMGVRDLLMKPVKKEALMEAIRKIFDE